MEVKESPEEALRKLRLGVDGKWPYVASLVASGDISRYEAVYALRSGLLRVRSDYTKLRSASRSGKIEGIDAVLADIKAKKPVIVYNNIQL